MSERVALVTGGTKGIGRAISMRLAKKGMKVYVNYSSDEAAAESTVSEICKLNAFGKAIKADVSNSEAVSSMFEIILKEAEKIDVLVNNAGIINDSLVMLMPEKDWHRVIEINLDSVYYCSKAVLRTMIGNK